MVQAKETSPGKEYIYFIIVAPLTNVLWMLRPFAEDSRNNNSLIELEVAAGIVVADVLNHLTQQLTVVGQQSLLHVIT